MCRNLLFLVIALVLTACGGFEPISLDNTVPPGFMRLGEGTLNPSTDKLDPNCKPGKTYDACIYLKNPVAQENAFVSLNQLQDLRDYGVKLHGLARSGYLENSRISVQTLFSKRFSLFDPGSLSTEWSMTDSHAEQLSAYYWANLAIEYLDKRMGASRVPLNGVKVYPDDGFTGVAYANNSIHLEKKSLVIPKALSGEVVVHLLGQMLAGKLSGGKVYQVPTQHNYCSLDPKGCCTTVNGCSTALTNAFGEYLAAMIFPNQAKVGEAVGESAQGQNLCGIRRDMAVLKTKTKSDVFNACPVHGRTPLMGAWYASVWWNLRVQAEATTVGDSVHIDKLFFDHAKAWTSTWTFAEAKAEALHLADTYEGGRFKTIMTAAFATAGL